MSQPTTCISPPPLSDDTLSDILEDIADVAAIKHTDNCEYCGSRLDNMRQADSLLTMLVYRSTCPSSQKLADYEFGYLPDEEHTKIKAHVAECNHCKEELNSLNGFLSAPLTPEKATQKAAPMPAFLPGYEYMGTIMEEVATVVRGAIAGPVIITVNEDFSVTLERVDIAGQMSITGQVLADDFMSYEGALVQVFEGSELLCVGRVGDLGDFECKLERATTEDLNIRIALPNGAFVNVPNISFAKV